MCLCAFVCAPNLAPVPNHMFLKSLPLLHSSHPLSFVTSYHVLINPSQNSFCLRQASPRIFFFDFYFLKPSFPRSPPTDLCLLYKSLSKPLSLTTPTFPLQLLTPLSCPFSLLSHFFFFYPFTLHQLSLARCHPCPSGPPSIPPSLHPSPSLSSPATSPSTVSHLSPQLSF